MGDIVNLKEYKAQKKGPGIPDPDFLRKILDSVLSEQMTVEEFAHAYTEEVLYEATAEFGLDFESNPKIAYDIFMIIEQLKSVIYRAQGVDYPVHQMNDNIVSPVLKNPEQFLKLFFGDNDG